MKSDNIADVSSKNVWIYGSIGLPLAMIGYPLGIWVPRLYSAEVGILLILVGTVIFLAAFPPMLRFRFPAVHCRALVL